MEMMVNRAQVLMENWKKRQGELTAFGGTKADRRTLLLEQYRFIGGGLARISAFPAVGEKAYIAVLESSQRDTLRALYPNALLRLLVRLKSLLWDRPKLVGAFRKSRAENLYQMEKLAKEKGFGAASGNLERVLDFERKEVELKMSGQLDAFRRLEVGMVLEKDGSGGYELSRFSAALNSGVEKVEYDFVDVGQLDLTRIGNLILGRSVFLKDGVGGSHWVNLQVGGAAGPQLNRFYPSYGFDLAAVLKETASALGIADLKHPKVLEELKNGNELSVSLTGSGNQKVVLSADPRASSLALRDEKGEILPLSKLVARKKQNEELKVNQPRIEPSLAKTIKLNKGRSLGMG